MVLSVNSCGSAIAEVSCCSPPAAGRHTGKSRALWHGSGNAGSNNLCAPLHNYHQDRNGEPPLREKTKRGDLAELCPCLGDTKIVPGWGCGSVKQRFSARSARSISGKQKSVAFPLGCAWWRSSPVSSQDSLWAEQASGLRWFCTTKAHLPLLPSYGFGRSRDGHNAGASVTRLNWEGQCPPYY